LANPTYCFDAWTVRKLETNDMGHEHWDNDDSIDFQQQAANDDDNDDDHEIHTEEHED
jgi:hypothetical protein